MCVQKRGERRNVGKMNEGGPVVAVEQRSGILSLNNMIADRVAD
jgi:hypothetical protein